MSRFEGGPVLTLELTCPNTLSMGGTTVWQRQCMDIPLTEIQNQPNVQLDSVFTRIDSESDCYALVQDLFLGNENSELPTEFLERFAEYLCRIGVLEAKPVWEAILLQLPEIATAN